MREGIHPNYNEIAVSCSCGNKFKVNSTLNDSLHLDVCNKCHPFYTGQQKIVDTTGRVERFNKMYNIPKVAGQTESKKASKATAEDK